MQTDGLYPTIAPVFTSSKKNNQRPPTPPNWCSNAFVRHHQFFHERVAETPNLERRSETVKRADAMLPATDVRAVAHTSYVHAIRIFQHQQRCVLIEDGRRRRAGHT